MISTATVQLPLRGPPATPAGSDAGAAECFAGIIAGQSGFSQSVDKRADITVGRCGGLCVETLQTIKQETEQAASRGYQGLILAAGAFGCVV